MALVAHALTTLATVKDELGFTDTVAARDARLERYINAASDLCVSYCSRQFHRTDEIEEKHAPKAGPFLFLARTPVLAIDSVTVDGSALASTDYELREVAPGVDGKLFRAGGWPSAPAGLDSPTQGIVAGYEEAIVTVTYDGGWVTPHQTASGEAFAGEERTLPYDLEDSIVMLAVTRWMTKGRDRSRSVEAYENATVTFGGVPVPPEVLGIWSRYALVPA